MITLYNKDFTTKYGTINSGIEAFVEEERNGLFELSFIMLNTDSLFKYIEEDNIVVANANNTLVNQKFRIYKTRKLMSNRVEVFARHISFDLMYDYIDNISFENQSCEYTLNSLFRNSNFSKHYRGYSDIVNAQNYSMSMANVLEAIGGKEGSLIDTFGTGAELLRDNENIHVLNKRGYDNSVSIEYKKNLTGFELEEDTTDLVTRILPYAKYTPKDSEGNLLEETTIKASFVDSPLLANYSHPFIKAIDYTDKFEEDEEVTISKLITFAQNEYRDNKVDIPKQNFKIEFIPLSKCVGYEGLEDNISLCDTVTIKDTRYNINTQAKVIKTTFNVLKNRYESMELGEPRTSLGDIIGSNDSSKGEQGPPGPQGPPGVDGSIGDFPNSLPSVPVVTAKVYGFANIEISWTFENKVYYQYEVYASKEADFTPNTFNLIHSGQTSTYMFQAKPNETWHFKVCAINTHEKRTNFGYAYATTTKVDDLSNYVGEMAIDNALIGTLNLDRGWVGTLKGNHIDAKNLSVTNGNGKRTLDIDSYGNVSLDVASLKISSSNVATENYADTKATQVLNDSKAYTITQTTTTNNKVAEIITNLDGITQRVSNVETKQTTTNDNITSLTTRMDTAESKITSSAIINTVSSTIDSKINNVQVGGTNLFKGYTRDKEYILPTYQNKGSFVQYTDRLTINPANYVGDSFTISFYAKSPNGTTSLSLYNNNGNPRYFYFNTILDSALGSSWKYYSYTFVNNDRGSSYNISNKIEIYAPNQMGVVLKNLKVERGNKATDWTPASEDISNEITSKVNTAKSEIKQTTDSITSTVSTINSNYVNATKVKSIIEQTPGSVKVGFNGISNNVEIDSNGMYFKRGSSQHRALGLQGSTLHFFNWSHGALHGGISSVLVGNNSDLNSSGITIQNAKNASFLSFGRVDTWADASVPPTAYNEAFVINYLKRGTTPALVDGIHSMHKHYFHQEVGLNKNNINNVNNITTNGLSASQSISTPYISSNTHLMLQSTSGANIDLKTGKDIVAYGAIVPSSSDAYSLGGWVNGVETKWAYILVSQVYGTSSKEVKSDIKRLRKDSDILNKSNEKFAEDINYYDFYELIKNINFATYVLDEKKTLEGETKKQEDDESKVQVGFIAEEIDKEKASKYFMHKQEVEFENYKKEKCTRTGYYIDLQAFTNAVAVALQKEIHIRDKQIEELISRIENLEKNFKVNKTLESGGNFSK